MKTFALLASLMLYSLTTFAQAKKNRFTLGGTVFLPVHNHNPGETNEPGYGINIKREHFYSKKFSGSLSLGCNVFKGEFTNWDGSDTQSVFVLIPVLIGVRYYIQKIYAGLETGVSVKGTGNASTKIAFVPSVGVVLSRFDFSVQFFSVPEIDFGIIERTNLQKGGYSYFGFRIGYNLR